MEPAGVMNADEQRLNGLRILVVDDNKDNRDFIEFLLQEYGAEVLAVDLANEALKLFAQFKPDILITDLSMPEKDGYWLIHQVRILDTDLGARIPVIVFTGKDLDDISVSEVEFQCYLRKPIDPDELIRAVAKLAIRQEK
ncbi:MAG: response regulator [Rhizonema sp. PD37]|nr:response regulator [Rhizonema sp. PD37]